MTKLFKLFKIPLPFFAPSRAIKRSGMVYKAIRASNENPISFKRVIKEHLKRAFKENPKASKPKERVREEPWVSLSLLVPDNVCLLLMPGSLAVFRGMTAIKS